MSLFRRAPRKRTFFRSPSGRLHGLSNCSGGAGRQRMTPQTMTPETYRAYPDKCRCCRWTGVDR